MSSNTTKTDDDTKEEEDDVDVRCGYGSCTPKLLQKLNNARVMLFIMCVFVFTQGFIVNGVFNVIVPTLERRFMLRSTQLGLVAAAYDLSAAILGVIVSYLGSGRHKARWLSVSAIFMTVGCVVMLLPHFTTPLYEWGEFEDKTCSTVGTNGTSPTCVSSGLQSYVGVFALSNIIFGVGGATLYTIGTAYIDDCVPSVTSPLYMGIFFGFAALGPGVGYLVAGAMLKIYVDFDKVDITSLSINEDDARWVGAWWIGAILSALVFVISIFTLACFGSELPANRKIREERESQLHKGSSGKLEGTAPVRMELKALPKVFKTLLKNPPFLFTTLAGITEALVISGLSAFVSKFVQNMFRVSSGTSGVLIGGVLVVGLAGGIAFGGFVCRCFRLKVKGMLMFAFISCLISTLCVFMFWLSCGQTNIAGVHSSYLPGTEQSLESTCNQGCGCTADNYEVSCDADGVQYFSPCYAGYKSSNGSEYSNCSCVAVSGNATVSMVTLGSCEKSCPLLYAFMVLFFVFTFASIAADVPAEQAVLRSIPENHKTIMCGSNRFLIRMLGTIPGAVIFGAATDAGCLIWQTECGVETSCWIYDNAVISRNYFSITLACKICSLIFFFLAHRFYVPPKEDDSTIASKADSDKNNIDIGRESHINETFNEEPDIKATHF